MPVRLNLVAYRNLVGVAYTEDEVKAMAEEIEVRERDAARGRSSERHGSARDASRRGTARAIAVATRAHPRPLGPHHASPGRVSGLATRRGRHASGEEKISNRSRRVCVSSGSARAQNLTSLIESPRLPPPQVTDGPDDTGEMFERPGKLSDKLPSPYANEEGARYANNRRVSPDLSLITKARHDGQNYVFSLLLGYRDPPAGISVREGLHYNPYFPGGAIAMPKMLVDGGVEYDDCVPPPSGASAEGRHHVPRVGGGARGG